MRMSPLLCRMDSPQVTQTWVDHEGDIVLINTVEVSQKYKNAVRNPKVALDICDPADSHSLAMIRDGSLM